MIANPTDLTADELDRPALTEEEWQELQRIMPVVMVPWSDGWRLCTEEQRIESANLIRDFIGRISMARRARSAEKELATLRAEREGIVQIVNDTTVELSGFELGSRYEFASHNMFKLRDKIAAAIRAIPEGEK